MPKSKANSKRVYDKWDEALYEYGASEIAAALYADGMLTEADLEKALGPKKPKK